MKVIVIGATGTIGAPLVKQLTDRGHEVVAASRHSAMRVDIAEPDSIESLFKQVPRADAVVCCAGEAVFKPFPALSDEDFQVGLHSKLMGQVNLARTAARSIADGGSITLTAGVLASQPMVGSASISLVNAALEGFVRAAALELPRGLRINVVSPPWVTETLTRLGMHAEVQARAADVALAYVALVEGTQDGQVVHVGGI